MSIAVLTLDGPLASLVVTVFDTSLADGSDLLLFDFLGSIIWSPYALGNILCKGVKASPYFVFFLLLQDPSNVLYLSFEKHLGRLGHSLDKILLDISAFVKPYLKNSLEFDWKTPLFLIEILLSSF